MQAGIDIVLILPVLVLLVPCAVLFLQLSTVFYSGAKVSFPVPAGVRAKLAVLMPAHDEEPGIAPSIRSVLGQLQAGDRLLVVADNCSDSTAAVAKSLGAEVVERHDIALRGKGYALDFGVRTLAADPPTVVVVIDADCTLAPGAVAALAAACVASGRPTQALYLMHAPFGAPLGLRVAAFAWLVKNKLRPQGGARLGWPCQLMGTGMAFSWGSLAAASLATGHLVEDMQLGLDLTRAGTPPLYCPQAVVSSVFPSDPVGVASQRARWEHGHLSTISSEIPRLLWIAARRSDLRLLLMALDLAVPPLASLLLMLTLLAIVTAMSWIFGGQPLPFFLTALAFALVGSALTLAWFQEGRRCVSARELAYLPIYAAAKIPLYLRLFRKRQAQWIRTRRDAGQP